MKPPEPSHSTKEKYSFASGFARAFPPPAILDLHAAGVDISDASVRWIVFEGERGAARVRAYGEQPLAAGIVERGIVRNVPALAEVLRGAKKKFGGVTCAHAALPEEGAYVFSMHVPEGESRAQILSMVEFELGDRVPIPPASAVFDYTVVTEHDGDAGTEIAVAVFPREAAEDYAAAFAGAGITLLSLEVEASSIARAISFGSDEEDVTLLVDFGRMRTGFAVLKHGVPIFTSTVEIGGEGLTQALSKGLALSPEEIDIFKDEEGLRAKPGSPGLEALASTVSAFADEVARHYRYWDTRRGKDGSRSTHVGRIVLVGGAANLKGLTDYVARRIHAQTDRAEVWRNVCSFEEYIPPIDYRSSLQYVTAIGLALRAL